MSDIYYNEIDKFAVGWLKSLMAAGQIPEGDIDTRSITEVRADEIRGYRQCHFFAGIGGWPLALRMAGIAEEENIWTGSCPCQPFSTAGKQKGKADERHLWPIWFNLIRQCRPATVFGEQVAAAIAYGWLDEVYDDLEKEGYACGSANLPACSVEEKTGRERIWFVGHTEHYGLDEPKVGEGLNTAIHNYQKGQDIAIESTGTSPQRMLATGVMESAKWLRLPDGRLRQIEPSIQLMANGIPNRVGKLRGYGNAIVPQVAAEFIKAAM